MEVLGKHSNDDMPDLEIRIWESIDGKAIKMGTIAKLSEKTPSCGMGCDNKMKWEQIFMENRTRRVIMSNNNYSCETTTRTVYDILEQNVPTTKCKTNSMWKFLDIHSTAIKGGTLYTDGAWKDTRKDDDILFSMTTNDSR